MNTLVYKIKKWRKSIYIISIYPRVFVVRGKVNLNRVVLALHILGYIDVSNNDNIIF